MKDLKLKALVISAAAVVVALMIIMLQSMNLHQLILVNAETGEYYKSFRLKDNSFSVTFVHSVNKSPVTDIYNVSNGNIVMTGTIYYGFGAGVPTELEENEKLSYGDNGEMIISDMNLKIYNLIYVVGTVSDHILEINDEKHSLRDLCGKNSKVLFKVK